MFYEVILAFRTTGSSKEVIIGHLFEEQGIVIYEYYLDGLGILAQDD